MERRWWEKPWNTFSQASFLLSFRGPDWLAISSDNKRLTLELCSDWSYPFGDICTSLSYNYAPSLFSGLLSDGISQVQMTLTTA